MNASGKHQNGDGCADDLLGDDHTDRPLLRSHLEPFRPRERLRRGQTEGKVNCLASEGVVTGDRQGSIHDLYDS